MTFHMDGIQGTGCALNAAVVSATAQGTGVIDAKSGSDNGPCREGPVTLRRADTEHFPPRPSAATGVG
jgi:hypothetical protein